MQLNLQQRLLAEATRFYEEAQGLPLNQSQANTAGQEAGGNLEQRIVARAQALSIASDLQKALQQLRHVFAWTLAISLTIALLAGATTAQMALGAETEGPINFFWLLGSILVVNTLALIAWLVLVFIQPSVTARGSPLGAAIFTIGRWFNHWIYRGPIYAAATQAMGSVYARSKMGRWTLSAVSHIIWLTFLVGSLTLVLFILSTQERNFAWETTILSDSTYVALTQALASVPEALGFVTPRAEHIEASHWTGGGDFSPVAQEAWSGLLAGSIVAYGILPRAFLLLLSLLLQWHAGRGFRLDTNQAGYSRLRIRLMPASQTIGIIDPKPPTKAAPAEEVPKEAPPVRATGPVAILGFEIGQPQSGWPPSLEGVDWLDLGLVEGRRQRSHAFESILSAPQEPRLIVAVCALTATPDRGTRTFIRKLQYTSHTPVSLVLTGGQQLRNRDDKEDAIQRVEDWHQVAAQAGVGKGRVIEVDLDHLTDISRSKLAKHIGVKSSAAATPDRIKDAFATILEHLAGWTNEPNATEQAELHRQIAQLYQGGERQSWQTLLHTKAKEASSQTAQLQTSASRMTHLLPGRLQQNPKWLATGALAGAMSCVAASTLVAPVAIAALPAWSGLGTAISAAIHSFAPQREDTAHSGRADLTEAVNSAALFTVVLELQGRDEATITRIIDEIAIEDEPPKIIDSTTAQDWLDTLRQRLNLALAAKEEA